MWYLEDLGVLRHRLWWTRVHFISCTDSNRDPHTHTPMTVAMAIGIFVGIIAGY